MRTHTQPPYPEQSCISREYGVTVLMVHLELDGTVSSATIERSSGYDRLDQAALEHVKAHWRWEPPTTFGGPYTIAPEIVNIIWELKDCQQ